MIDKGLVGFKFFSSTHDKHSYRFTQKEKKNTVELPTFTFLTGALPQGDKTSRAPNK